MATDPETAAAQTPRVEKEEPRASPAPSVGDVAPPAIPPPAQAQAAQVAPKVPRNSNGTIMDTPTARLKTACSQCRQQKIKCRLNDENAISCERCARMQLPCLFEPRNARGRPRSDSDAGAEASKRRLISKSSYDEGIRTFTAVNAPNDSRPSGESSSAILAERRASLLPELPYPQGRNGDAGSGAYNGAGSSRFPEVKFPPPMVPTPIRSHVTYQSPTQTIARSLDDVLQVDAETIDTLFALYFRLYHPSLPVLDPNMRPNEYWAESDFLFWAILAVASRRSQQHEAFMRTLRTRLLISIPTTLFSPYLGSNTIAGILILLSWKMPDSDATDEMPFTHASALLHAAMRIGMHDPDRTQDFSRIKVTLSDAEAQRRYEVYNHCLVLYNSSSAAMGMNPCEVFPIASESAQQRQRRLPRSLIFHSRISRALVDSSFELVRSTPIAVIVKRREELLKQISEPVSGLDGLYVHISQLMFGAFQFLQSSAEQHQLSWKQSFDAATNLIHELHDLEKTMHIDLYGTVIVYHGVLLAACTLLRCLKTPFADSLGREGSTGQALFFSAINMMRNISLREGDQPSKSAWALQQLWRSDTAFKKQDGSSDLDLRVRNRFGSSIIYDTMVRSREEQLRSRDSGHHGPTFNGFTNGPRTDEGFETDMTYPQDWVLSE